MFYRVNDNAIIMLNVNNKLILIVINKIRSFYNNRCVSVERQI